MRWPKRRPPTPAGRVARPSVRWTAFPTPPGQLPGQGLTAASGSPAFRTWWPSAMPSPSSACVPPGRSAWARPTCRPWPTAACSAASTAARRAVQCRLPHRALRLGVLQWRRHRHRGQLRRLRPGRGNLVEARPGVEQRPVRLHPFARGDLGARQLAADADHGRGGALCAEHGRPAGNPRRSGRRRSRYPRRPLAHAALGADPQGLRGTPGELPGPGRRRRGPWPASASACRACSSTPTPMRAPASPRDRRPDRPAHPYPALGHRPLGTGAHGPGSRRRRSDRGGLPAGVELRGRPTRRAHRVQPRPGVEGIPPRRAVGTLGLGLRRLPARQWRSEAEPPGGCRRPADLPHDPGTLPNREGDLAAGMDEYVRMAERGIKPWDRIATLPDGLRGLEETRRIDLEEWMRRLRLDAVLFPTVADVGRRTPTSTRPRPTSPGATVSGSPTATSPSATSACRRSPYRWG